MKNIGLGVKKKGCNIMCKYCEEDVNYVSWFEIKFCPMCGKELN